MAASEVLRPAQTSKPTIMKTRKMLDWLSLNRLSFGTLLALMVLTACTKQQTTEQGKSMPPGRIAETWRFWEAFNKAAVSGVGVEVLKREACEGMVEAKDIEAVFEDIVEGEQARSRAVIALPVLHVAPELTAYAIQSARLRMDLANVLRDVVTLAKKQEDMTSMDYEVITDVKGMRSGQERRFKLRLTYGWFYTRWCLLDLQRLQ